MKMSAKKLITKPVVYSLSHDLILRDMGKGMDGSENGFQDDGCYPLKRLGEESEHIVGETGGKTAFRIMAQALQAGPLQIVIMCNS